MKKPTLDASVKEWYRWWTEDGQTVFKRFREALKNRKGGKDKMKKLALLLLLCAVPASAFDGPYFQGIWEQDNYKHAATSLNTLVTPKGAFDGMALQTALVWHKGDPANTLIPERLQALGVKPFSWTLLACGGSAGNGEAAFVCGSSVNVAPTLLGPLADLLKGTSSGIAQAVGDFIAKDPNASGAGLNLGYAWSAKPIVNGAMQPLNHWGSKLDAAMGLAYVF